MSVSVLIAREFVLPQPIEAQWLSWLPQSRRMLLAGWADVRERHRSLIGSRLLARGLQQWGYSPGEIASLRYPGTLRPTLDLPVGFSLSHCEGRIVCALSTHVAVGVDVEALGGLTADEFQLYLTASERAWAGRSSRRFYSIWTRKEAVAKAAGTIGLPALRAIDTAPDRHSTAFGGTMWRTPAVEVGRGYIAHLALADANARITVSRLEPQQLGTR